MHLTEGELRLTYREIIIQEKYNKYYILIYNTTQFEGGTQKQLRQSFARYAKYGGHIC